MVLFSCSDGSESTPPQETNRTRTLTQPNLRTISGGLAQTRNTLEWKTYAIKLISIELNVTLIHLPLRQQFGELKHSFVQQLCQLSPASPLLLNQHYSPKTRTTSQHQLHLQADPATPQAHSINQNTHNFSSSAPTTTLNPNQPKRNWGAADFDQGGLGKHHLPSKKATNPPLPTGTPLPPESDNPTIYSSLRDLFRHISTQPTSVGAVAPQAFITTLKRYNELFRSTMHQDAHEFLNYLVNSVAEDVLAEEEKKRLKDRPASLLEPIPPSHQKTSSKAGHSRSTWVHRLFEGVLTNETKCLTCETVTQRDESFLDLSINIHQNTSLTACLRQFSASEMLCQKNKFSCDQCCSLQEAEKRMKIKKLPNVLALHLKRFKYQENLQRYTKLSYRVVFPFELKLFNTTDDIQYPDRLYELWAIVVHIGALVSLQIFSFCHFNPLLIKYGPHHGHYVTILKSYGQWLLFDDNVVTRIEERDIQKYYGDTPGVGSGYVLFYQATDLDLMDLMGVPPEPDEAEGDSELGTEDSEDAAMAAMDDSTQNTMATAQSSTSNAELKMELPQLSTWNGFQQPSTADPSRKNSMPLSSCLSSASSSSSHPPPSTSQQCNLRSPSSSARTLSTSDQCEHPTSNSSRAELATQLLPQPRPNSPNLNSQLASSQLKLSVSGKLSRSPSGATKLSTMSRSGSLLAPASIDCRLSQQSSPDSVLLSPFLTGPSLPKTVLTQTPVRVNPNLPSPQTTDDPLTRSNLPTSFPASPVLGPTISSGSSNSKTSTTAPTLHRKFSLKFLRRKKSSGQSTQTADSSSHSSPTIGGGDSALPTSSNTVYPSSEPPTRNSTPHHHHHHHHHQPVSSSPLGPDPTDKQQQHFFSPRPLQGSYRHSISTALDANFVDTSPQGPRSLPTTNNRHSVHSAIHSDQDPSTKNMMMMSPNAPRPLSIITKGAQAPPATSSLTEKQQREIKRASEKASKQAAKNKLRALHQKAASQESGSAAKAAKLAAQFKFSKFNQSYDHVGGAHHHPQLGGSHSTTSHSVSGGSFRLRSSSISVGPIGDPPTLASSVSSSSKHPTPPTLSDPSVSNPAIPSSNSTSSRQSRPSPAPALSRPGSFTGFLRRKSFSASS
ncbi:ubiquitin carboxyl-terminal hydrolase [Puccinia sorghi]|uniref:ubiquitinyl hydrolase 1 n=1 Tax=Puccinia sorghi TaxID=27349 RepID=A0A0L6UN82_9BASI|nr:ubiquitin carboxyl-terminal hydrolase [Puccinia sorghi]